MHEELRSLSLFLALVVIHLIALSNVISAACPTFYLQCLFSLKTLRFNDTLHAYTACSRLVPLSPSGILGEDESLVSIIII